MDTDKEWERWGKNDPYFGVITHTKFRRKNLTGEAIQEFFESGRRDVKRVLDTCRQYLDKDFSPRSILDFGCGTGRLIVPFSEVSENVVGLDVSDSMLKECEKNCREFSATNVRLIKSDDNLSQLQGKFDLIHSLVVFQHLPVDRGIYIIDNLLRYLNEGGICALQITYSKIKFQKNMGIPNYYIASPNTILGHIYRIRQYIIILARNLNTKIQKNRGPADPGMQMNPYNMNQIFFKLQTFGIKNIYLDFTDHGGELGVYLYFKKTSPC